MTLRHSKSLRILVCIIVLCIILSIKICDACMFIDVVHQPQEINYACADYSYFKLSNLFEGSYSHSALVQDTTYRRPVSEAIVSP